MNFAEASRFKSLFAHRHHRRLAASIPGIYVRDRRKCRFWPTAPDLNSAPVAADETKWEICLLAMADKPAMLIEKGSKRSGSDFVWSLFGYERERGLKGCNHKR